jgi:Fe-S-cluster containining protein
MSMPNCATCTAHCCAFYDWIAVTIAEMRTIAKYIGVAELTFRFEYLQRTPQLGVPMISNDHYGLRLKENNACVFHDFETNKCTIYPVRPQVCREYEMAGRRCKAVRRLWPLRKEVK